GTYCPSSPNGWCPASRSWTDAPAGAVCFRNHFNFQTSRPFLTAVPQARLSTQVAAKPFCSSAARSMAKYRRSSMAWSCSFFGASRRPLSSQQYVSISRRQSAQAPQITIRRRFSRSAVTRMPSATSLSA
ncbi:RidA family protein, partial [Dysosmobacter welbionis]